MNLDRMRAAYEAAFRTHGDSPAAVLWPKGRQELRFDALTRHIHGSRPFSVLDYGCGLAHLKPFLEARYGAVTYAGADAVVPFVETCRLKFPAATFYHAQSPVEIPSRYDYVVAAGAFNIRYTNETTAHRDCVFHVLEQLFEKADVFVAVDFMTDVVDYQHPDAYHQNVAELHAFVSGRLSRRLVLDQSYLPFEYAMTIWKDQRIERPSHVYASG